MLRVTTIYASGAAASAQYYANYLTQAPGEVPGVWAGNQAADFGLAGDVAQDDLLALLEARDPVSETPLGRPFRDRTMSDGRVERAVAGFDATFSAPKSVSVLWALTQDERFLDAHDTAVSAALAHLERFGATTRIRKGTEKRFHADTNGLTIAKFRQTTSRADDPDLHTHSVISNKVRTSDGRWLALDGAYMKKHQRMLGGIYQSVLRNDLTHRFGFEWEPIENGQAEIAGVPKDVLRLFSKRTAEVEAALGTKVAEFVVRQGREPSQWERAALTREAAVDTRSKKSGIGVADLTTRWTDEAESIGWSWPEIVDEALEAAQQMSRERRTDHVTTLDIIDHLTAEGSVWNRADIMKAVCDLTRPSRVEDGERWAASLEQACDWVMRSCVGLDPADTAGPRRTSDGRSVWVAPTSRHMTSDRILGEEDYIISWAMDAQDAEPEPSPTVDVEGLDVMQAEVARAVAGNDRLVLAVGPAGAGKTTTLRTAVNDLHDNSRQVFGVAPSAKAARVLERETGVRSDTLAKLLHEWERRDRPPGAEFALRPGATVLVDEAGMVGTFALARLISLAERQDWRLVLIGDHHQLQAVGRGGMFHELCRTGRAIELDRIHRFAEPWEAAASLQLRHGDPGGLDAYIDHDRVVAAPFDEHLRSIADTWLDTTSEGGTVTITASTNEHVDSINSVVQKLRIEAGQLSIDRASAIGGGEQAHIGDVVVTRQNDRRLETNLGEPVRNRESWTVEAIAGDGSLTVSSNAGSGQVTLPVEYARQHVRLGYAATEHGNQGDTVTVGIELATVATTQRGLYVGVSRGREDNKILVVTEGHDLAEARDILERILASDRADIPATTQRRRLAEMDCSTEPAPRAALRHPAVARPASEQRRPRPRRGTIRVPDRAPPTRRNVRQTRRGRGPTRKGPKGVRALPPVARRSPPRRPVGTRGCLGGQQSGDASQGVQEARPTSRSHESGVDAGRCASQAGRRRSCCGSGQEPCRRGKGIRSPDPEHHPIDATPDGPRRPRGPHPVARRPRCRPRCLGAMGVREVGCGRRRHRRCPLPTRSSDDISSGRVGLPCHDRRGVGYEARAQARADHRSGSAVCC